MSYKKIEDLIGNFYAVQRTETETTPQMDEKVLTNALTAHKKSEQTQPAQTRQNIWRTIMKNRITKLSTAAAIILIAVFGVTLLDKAATPAWAIEQTIEAFEKVNSVYVEQILREKGSSLNIKMWARRGSHGKFFFGDFRQEAVDYGDTTVVNESENRTYYYNPSTQKVYLYERLNVTIGDFLDRSYFLFLQQEMENVELEYGKDKITGKEVVILKYKIPIPSKYDKSFAKSQVITFDLETKLPIRWISWDNTDFKGKPFSEWTSIEYNPELPEDTFQFEIPEAATVIRE